MKFSWLLLLTAILMDESGSTLAITRKVAGTAVTAAKFNDDADKIEAVVNGGIEAANIAADAVNNEKIDASVVRSGYGLSQHTDGTLQVDPSDTNPGLEISDGGLRTKVDDSTIERASGGIQVKDSGITNAKLAGSIADSKLNQITTAEKVSVSAITGTLGLANGGTGATTQAAAHAAISPIGATASKNLTTAYQALTDGFLVVFASISGSSARSDISGYTDANSDPSTQMGACSVCSNGQADHSAPTASFMFPVKKNNYYKVTKSDTAGSASVTIYFIPIGA